MTYRVVVEREGAAWLADVPQVQGAHTWAPDLPMLERYVREVIVLMDDDLPSRDHDALDLEWVFETGEQGFDRIATSLSADRATLDVPDERARALAADLGAQGWAVRDIAWLLGVPPRRVGRWVPRAARGVAHVAR